MQTAHTVAWDGFIASLRYCGIAVNVPITYLFGQMELSLGAFPGNTPQKSVLYGAASQSPSGWWKYLVP